MFSELLWNASIEELKKGYTLETDQYVCLLCGTQFEKGRIYPDQDRFYDAERFTQIHIEQYHGSVFEYLIHQDKKITGLTDHQKNLLHLFYQGKSDPEVQKEMGIGSASTIRNHRFALKEKERQAKIFLTLMELLQENGEKQPKSRALQPFPKKLKDKRSVLEKIVKQFDPDQIYTEKEINDHLKETFDDYVMVRRYLIDLGFLERKPEGSEYWVKSAQKEEKSEKGMEELDRKKELKQQYKETKSEAGVYQIRNTQNNKIYIDSTTNLKTLSGKLFQLKMGSHMNKALQAEWNQYGEDAFVFEVLEILKENKNEYVDPKDDLKKLEQKWLDHLQPYGDQGYNKKKS
ncbi:DUF2087 domain-containing protein [Ammoniphilus resinae]|uniref:DNA-binding CsgD family transcriptional regulator n=1 Tax=Ammoniphilus resinae TaxID=861532 RepID=A0ABS4GUS8_9BACL|nr:DUF2087 domain-containing protein [Ammoniphilus resinae]MBP1934040.1 DNA-binding CsgD family transcriptional regulator [Ammoniphilus resinae]